MVVQDLSFGVPIWPVAAVQVLNGVARAVQEIISKAVGQEGKEQFGGEIARFSAAVGHLFPIRVIVGYFFCFGMGIPT